MKLFYLDDSGSIPSGLITFSWLELDIGDWRGLLGRWLDYRKYLWLEAGIPVSFEFHANNFINGRSRPSEDPKWNDSKRLRREVTEEMLGHLIELPGLKLGSVQRATVSKRHAYADEKADLYRHLLAHLNHHLSATGDLGLVIVDGDATERSYQKAHRDLRLQTRSIIEDPVFQNSHESQLIQIADLVAYLSFQHLARLPRKEFAWRYYNKYLAELHPPGHPLQL